MAKGRFARINLDGKSCSKTKLSTAAALAADFDGKRTLTPSGAEAFTVAELGLISAELGVAPESLIGTADSSDRGAA